MAAGRLRSLSSVSARSESDYVHNCQGRDPRRTIAIVLDWWRVEHGAVPLEAPCLWRVAAV
jgi:hypothetical protein